MTSQYFFTLDNSIVYVHICVWDTCAYVCMRKEARGQHQVFSLITLYFLILRWGLLLHL